MATFVFTYRMPAGYVPGGPGTMAAWAAWFDGMGESLCDRGNPVFESAKLGNCAAQTSLGATPSSMPGTLNQPSRWPRDPLPSRQAAASRWAPPRAYP